MKYRKKPVVIEAIQWNGFNHSDIERLAEGYGRVEVDINDAAYQAGVHPPTVRIYIHTLEGIMEATKGDFIIRGIAGELYPCKPDIFEKSYEPVLEVMT